MKKISRLTLILCSLFTLTGCIFKPENGGDNKQEEEQPYVSPIDFPLDFRVDAKDANRGFKIVQISDPQVAPQMKPLTTDAINTEFQQKVYKYIDPVISEVDPDLIFIAGDIVYGRYDNANQIVLKTLLDHINNYGIPWAPVFGNHDNETPAGIDAQCNLISSYSNVLFKRNSELTGNSNYSIGCFVNDKLVRSFYCLDSKGCAQVGGDKSNVMGYSIDKVQIDYVVEKQQQCELFAGKSVPGFIGQHVMYSVYVSTMAFRYNIMVNDSNNFNGKQFPAFEIGPNNYGDSGIVNEAQSMTIDKNGDAYFAYLDCHIDGIFTGHCHQINTIVTTDEGVVLAYGLKSSTYDFYQPTMLGATEISINSDSSFEVKHHFVHY